MWIALALSGLVVAGVTVALVTETERPWPGRLADTMLVTAVAALVVAAVFAWNQPAAPYREQELPGMGQAVTITVVTVGATLALLLATVLAGTTIRARGCLLMLSIADAILLALHLVPLANFPAARLVGTAALAAGLIAAGSVARRAYDRFRWAAPFVVMSLAVGVLNCFMLGVLVQVADAVGDIRHLAMNRPETDEPVITVLINRVLTPYLVVMTAAVTLVFLVWQGVLVRRATRGPEARWPGPSRPGPALHRHCRRRGVPLLFPAHQGRADQRRAVLGHQSRRDRRRLASTRPHTAAANRLVRPVR